MSINKKKIKTLLYQCKTCSKEIPESAALTAEGADYVWHFCGQKCYIKWQEKKKKNVTS